MSDSQTTWIEIGWAATDPSIITTWKREVESLMELNPHKIGAMAPQSKRPPKPVDATGTIPGFAICIRANEVATLKPPEGLIPMAPWAASALFAAMDDGPSDG